MLYGENHPYGTTALGSAAAVTRFTRDDLARFHDQWIRPDNLRIFVVSSLPLAELQPLLDQRFGSWTAPAGPKGQKTFSAIPPRPSRERIVLVDRPDSPQSMIYAGEITPLDPRSDVIPTTTANDVLGGNFLSRINTDLRETKGWTYGTSGNLQMTVNAVPYILQAPVQADRTADSIVALSQQIRGYLGPNGVTEEELEPDRRQEHQRIARTVRDVGGSAQCDADQSLCSGARTIITSCWRTATAPRPEAASIPRSGR